eukprot:scaffold300_cov258-Pinguiococcus_pyrenoidosus.AAC.10
MTTHGRTGMGPAARTVLSSRPRCAASQELAGRVSVDGPAPPAAQTPPWPSSCAKHIAAWWLRDQGAIVLVGPSLGRVSPARHRTTTVASSGPPCGHGGPEDSAGSRLQPKPPGTAFPCRGFAARSRDTRPGTASRGK